MTDQKVANGRGGEPPFKWNDFWDTARRFAHAAAENYSPGDAPFFFLHAGASVELGVKSVLCFTSPVLLIEGGGRFKDTSLVRLLGFDLAGGGARMEKTQPESAPVLFTVGFEQALSRFALLHGDGALGVSKTQLDEVKAARDVTAHGSMGSGPVSDSMDRILVALGTVHSVLAPMLGSTAEDFWAEHYRLVNQVITRKRHGQRELLVLYTRRRGHGSTPSTQTLIPTAWWLY